MNTRILIVEDEVEIRRSMRLTLERSGYEIGEAADGETGLQQFGDGSKWAAVLLDQRMPGMDGLETLRRMKARNPTVRVVMVTAYGSIELAVDAMKLGATDFVRKPVTPEILRNAVKAAVAERERPSDARPLGELAGLGPARPLVSRVTMNGFRFWPAAQEADAAANARVFAVEHPDGRMESVRVEIPREAMAQAEQMTRRQFPLTSEFWTAQAEHTLAGFLWGQGRIPPDGRLCITQLDYDTVKGALS